MQRNGLKWFYRLCVRPSRLWRRYLVNNPLFLLRLLAQATGLCHHPVENDPTANSTS